MYSNKENVNILTSLLLEYGVSDAVVCPGSRNAPIVHNLSVCEAIRCRPVTDERSAAFYALGLAIATRRPTVVCVTSGSALLNVTPAVAEAAYQHVPLVVISADRPQQWIDQLDGQTIPQSDALGRFVRKAVQLPEPHNDEERWLCRRLVNEAMHLATCRQGAPVHINVPISEPLFEFSTEQLPQLSRFNNIKRAAINDASMDMPDAFHEAKRPMIVIGQLAHGTISHETIRSLSEKYVVMSEPLSSPSYMTIHFDEAIRYIVSDNSSINDDEDDKTAYYPDYVIYVGDTLVSKPARRFLRNAKAPSCLITPDAADIHDPLMTLTDIVECDSDSINALLASLCDAPDTDERCRFHDRWQSFLDACAAHADAYTPEYSQMATVKYFEEQLADLDIDICVHYANSSAVRLACIYAQHYVWCNRGVNGIEGSLSTAAGCVLRAGRPEFLLRPERSLELQSARQSSYHTAQQSRWRNIPTTARTQRQSGCRRSGHGKPRKHGSRHLHPKRYRLPIGKKHGRNADWRRDIAYTRERTTYAARSIHRQQRRRKGA